MTAMVDASSTPSTIERQLKSTSAGAALLARLLLSTTELDQLLRAQGTPLLHKRLKALGVAKMGHRLQIAKALSDQADGRSPPPPVMGSLVDDAPQHQDDDNEAPSTPTLQDNRSVPSSPCLESNNLSTPQSPATTSTPSTIDAAVVAAAVGCTSPTAGLIRAYCSASPMAPVSAAPAEAVPPSASSHPTPLATRIPNVMFGSAEPRSRKSPNGSRGRGKSRPTPRQSNSPRATPTQLNSQHTADGAATIVEAQASVELASSAAIDPTPAAIEAAATIVEPAATETTRLPAAATASEVTTPIAPKRVKAVDSSRLRYLGCALASFGRGAFHVAFAPARALLRLPLMLGLLPLAVVSLLYAAWHGAPPGVRAASTSSMALVQAKRARVAVPAITSGDARGGADLRTKPPTKVHMSRFTAARVRSLSGMD